MGHAKGTGVTRRFRTPKRSGVQKKRKPAPAPKRTSSGGGRAAAVADFQTAKRKETGLQQSFPLPKTEPLNQSLASPSDLGVNQSFASASDLQAPVISSSASPSDLKQESNFESLQRRSENFAAIGFNAFAVLPGPGKRVITGSITGVTIRLKKLGFSGRQIVSMLRYPKNAKNLRLTNEILTIAGMTIGAAGVALTILGSYPFAGFIKEEALQTLSFGVKTAIANEDIEGAEKAIALQEEILDVTITENILNKIPILNVVRQLEKFFEAARIKLEIDRKMTTDLKIKIETGETDTDRWIRNKREENQMDIETIDYYNKQRKLMVQWELDAKAAQRNEDAAFWRNEKAKQRKLEEADRKAISDFWILYRKEVLKLQENSRPSKLNFGLL